MTMKKWQQSMIWTLLATSWMTLGCDGDDAGEPVEPVGAESSSGGPFEPGDTDAEDGPTDPEGDPDGFAGHGTTGGEEPGSDSGDDVDMIGSGEDGDSGGGDEPRFDRHYAG